VFGRLGITDQCSVDQDPAAGDRLEMIDTAKQRRFARTPPKDLWTSRNSTIPVAAVMTTRAFWG
jgi:hypothetical protein